MADFVIGDYEYTILSSTDATVRAQVVDNTKSSYDDIPSVVKNNNVDYTVTQLSASVLGYGCFSGCTSLVTSPSIPSTVTLMRGTFSGCTSLIAPPEIPEGVEGMTECFDGCTSLTYAPVIPSSVRYMYRAFRGCSSLNGDIYIYTSVLSNVPSETFVGTTQNIVLHSMNSNASICDQLASTADNGNVYVNVRPEEGINFIDTEMNYMTSGGLKQLSLQTNANLVQCEVPDLVNGGTITTNVNDALVDLASRSGVHPAFVGTIVKNGVSFTNNGDGSFTINGTAQQRVDQSLLVATLIGAFRYKFTGGYVKWLTIGTIRRLIFGVQLIQKDAVGRTWESMPTQTGAFDEMLSSSTIYAKVNFTVRSGETVDNLTITPAITKVGDV